VIVKLWVTALVSASGGMSWSSSPSASSVPYDERHRSPSNSSSDVSRQYDASSLTTVKTWASDCSTSRGFRSTIGLLTSRVGSSLVRSRHATSASAPAPGRRGPAAVPTTTARPVSAAPVAISDDRPWLRWWSPAHRDVRSWLAVRCTSTNSSADPANSAAPANGLPGPPSAAENTNRVVAGSRASKVAHTRNAAQSATNTMAQMAAALTARNPLCTGAGARTSPKVRHAPRRSSPTASSVLPVGSSQRVVSGNRAQAMNSAARPMQASAAGTMRTPARRSRATSVWATIAWKTSGPRYVPSANSRCMPTTAAMVSRARQASLASSMWSRRRRLIGRSTRSSGTGRAWPWPGSTRWRTERPW
jgi:hypothetical protein